MKSLPAGYFKAVLPLMAIFFAATGAAYAAGITIPAGAYFKANSSTVSVPGDVSSGGTLVLTSGTVILTGNWANNGTLTAGSGTIDFAAGEGSTQNLNSGGTGSGKAFYHLKHSGAGTLELLTSPVEINGNFTNSAGVFDAKGLGILVAGSWSNTAAFTHSSATVTFDGASGTPSITALPANGTFYDLVFAASGITYTAATDLTVERDLAVTSGTLNDGGGVLTVGRNWSVHASNGGFVSSGTVIFNGTAAQVISTGGTNATHDFASLTHSGSGNLQLNSSYDLAVNGALAQSGAGDFDTQGRAVSAGSLDLSDGTFNSAARAGTWTVSGNVAIVSPAALTATSGTFNIGGSFTNGGVFAHNSGSIVFNATSGTPSISAPVAGGAFNNLAFNDAGANITFALGTPIEVANNLTIAGGTLNAASQDISVGGDWDNNDTFTPGDNTVTFNAVSTGKVVEAGTSSFHNAVFDSASGGWVVQTDDLTCTGDLSLTSSAAFTLASGRTLEVRGQFANHLAGGATTWTGSTLYLNGSGSGEINAKTEADTYAALHIGAAQAARMWSSSAGTYTIDPGGSLYSMDHAGADGELYVWGSYVVPPDANDYWGYATDFDAEALSSGNQRQCKVYLFDGASVVCGEGEALRIVGADGYPTLVDRQGASGTYGITVNSGLLRAQYYSIQHINGSGLNLLGAATVVSNLDYGSFDNSEGTGSTDAFITVAGEVITNNPAFLSNGCLFDNTNANADFNVRATGTTASFWNFSSTSGSFDGESLSSDPGGNPGYLVWDDSAGATISISGTAFDDDDEAVTAKSARVSLAVNDQYQNYVTTNASSGTFSFSGISVKAGDSLTLYFDNEVFKGSLVTVVGSGNVTGLKLYKNHLVARTEPAGALSINQMALYDKDNDSDINFDAEDSAVDTLVIDDGAELFIPSGKEFQPLGNLQDGTAGVWDIDNRGTFSCVAFEQIRVSGSWLNGAAATFTCANSIVRFDGSSGTPAINSAGDAFYDLVINSTVACTAQSALAVEHDLQVTSGTLNPSSYDISAGNDLIVDGGWLNAAGCSLDVGNDVALSSGTLTAPASGESFTVGGNWSNTGATFTSGTGTVVFDKASGTQTINGGGTGNDSRDFTNLSKSGGGSLQLAGSGLEVDGTLTVSASTTLELNGQDLNLGTLSNSGIIIMLGSEAGVAIAAMDTAKGEVVYTGDGDEIPEEFIIKNFGALDYYDLTVNDTNTTKDTFRTAADISVNHDLDVLAGTLDISYNGNALSVNGATTINGGALAAANGNIDAGGDLVLTSGALTAPGSGKYFRLGASLGLAGTFEHSSGQLTFDAVSGTPSINSGGNALHDLVFNDAGNGVTFTLAGAVECNDLTIASGTLDTGSDHGLTVGGNWINDGSFVSHASTVTFNKSSGTQTIDAGGIGSDTRDFQTLVKTGGGTLQLSGSGLEVDGTLTIGDALILDINGLPLTAGTLSNAGQVRLSGAEAVNISSMAATAGTVTYLGDGDLVQDTFSVAGFGGSQYYNLAFNDTHDTKDTFQTSQDLSVANDLTIDGGTFAAASHNIAVNGSLTVTSGTCTAPSTGRSLTIGGDLNVAGTFTPGSGSVVFNDNSKASMLDAPEAGLTFNNLTCSTASKVLNFAAGDTFTVEGALTLDGGSVDSRIDLNSTGGAGTSWNLVLTGSASCQYLDLQGSQVSGTVVMPIDPAGSLDSGDNNNWFSIGSSSDSNMLRNGADRHTFFDGSSYWIFYIDDDGNVVYTRSSGSQQWGAAVTVASGDYTSLGIWEDGTSVWCCYADSGGLYERPVTISSGAPGTERTLKTSSARHPQLCLSASGYLHAKSEGSTWKVYRYSGRIGTAATATVNITPVTSLDRAFIVGPSGRMSVGCGYGGATQNASAVMVRAAFASTSQVTLTRGAASGYSDYSFYVVEETSGSDIYVVRGTTAFSSNRATTASAALSGISDYSKCVVFLTVSSNSSSRTYYHQAHVKGYVDSSNTLQLSRTAGNVIPTVDWFVVEFKGNWSVQQGDFSVTTGTNASPQTQAITSVDPDRSFVLMNWSVNYNGVGVDTPKVELYNATTLRFSRQTYSSASYYCSCRWFVVSHPHLSVQRGTAATAADTNLTVDQSLTGVDISRALPLTFNDSEGTTGTEFPAPYWICGLSDSQTLNWTRSYAGTAGSERSANFKWQVMEFPLQAYFWQRSAAAGDDSAWDNEALLARDSEGCGHCQIVPLTGSSMMALYNDYTGGSYTLKYAVYDGAAWSAAANAVTDCQDSVTTEDQDRHHYFSAVSDDAGYVYLIYQDTSGNIRYSSYQGAAWSPPQTISDDPGCSDPSLFFDQAYETLYAFWLDGTDLKYKRYVRSWSAAATTLHGDLDTPASPGCAYADDASVSLVWREKAAAPYSVSFASMNIVPTIVDLSELYALGYAAKAKIVWRTGSEINNAGFNIYRSAASDSGFTKVNAGLIPGQGTSALGSYYEYWDEGVSPGQTFYYILESVELSGLSRRFGPVSAHPGLDTDGDAISDDYEYFYGLDPAANDAVLDPDSDGLTNLQEYTAGSDPYAAVDADLSWSSSSPGASPGVTVISSGGSEMVLELSSNSFTALERKNGADTYQLLSFPEYAHGYNDDAGKPQIPVKSVLVNMSQKRPLKVEILDYDVEEFSGYMIYPVPERKLVTRGSVAFLANQFYKDAAAYLSTSAYPGMLAEADYASYLRGQSVARIKLYPLQFNPSTGGVTLYKRLRVKLTTQDAAAASASTGGSGVPAGTAAAYRITLSADGIYRIGYAGLVAAGMSPASIDPRLLKVYYRGAELAVYVSGEEDGAFNEGDYLEFYGQKNDSRYSYGSAYWLVPGGAAGKRMQAQTSGAGPLPASFLCDGHFEENTLYWMESDSADPWYYSPQINAGATQSYSAALTDALTSGENAILKVNLRGYSWGDVDVTHHIKLFLNNHLVTDCSWLNNADYTASAEVPSYILVSGANTLKLESVLDAPGDASGLALLDSFDISYWRRYKADNDYLECTPQAVGAASIKITDFSDANIRIFDVTDPAAAKLISPVGIADEGGSFSASFNADCAAGSRLCAVSDAGVLSPDAIAADIGSSLRSAANQADYVIITVDDLAPQIEPLAAYRRSKGLNVVVAKLSDVYDEFNYGMPSAQAIKDFLYYAYSSWKKPAPVYALLAGDGTYDYRDDEGYGFTNYLPSAMIYSDEFGETASDDWFACFDGSADIFPEMLIGRFPAKTAAEVTAMVNKTIAYEAVSLDELWTKRDVFVADNGGLFEPVCENLAASLPAGYTASKVYLSNFGSPAACKSDIVSKFNQGALLLNYVGHGGIQGWAEETIFENDTIASLANKDKYPFVLTLNCVNGYFIHPMYSECLAEELLRAPDKGAVAVLAPSGMSLTDHQKILAEGIYDSLFKQKERILGSVAAKGKLYLFQEAGNTAPQTLKQFNLFGDPALVLRKEAPAVAETVAQPAVYTVSAKVAPMYSFSSASDAKALYPSMLFEPQIIPPDQAMPGRQPAGRIAESVLRSSKGGSVRTSAVSALRAAQKQPVAEKGKQEESFVYENKIVRLGPVTKEMKVVSERQKGLARKTRPAEIPAAGEPAQRSGQPKGKGFWQGIVEFWQDLWKRK